MDKSDQNHWDKVFTSKAPQELTWFQPQLSQSLGWIAGCNLDPGASIIDVGAGDSTLVDHLLDLGYTQLTALDLSDAALQRLRQRLGARLPLVSTLLADITRASLPPASFDFWHDRACFHFLVQPDDRRRYCNALLSALRPAGYALLCTFAEDGPERCSGLPTMRYSPASLLAELVGAAESGAAESGAAESGAAESGAAESGAAEFELLRSAHEGHRTPWGGEQKFLYCLFRRL